MAEDKLSKAEDYEEQLAVVPDGKGGLELKLIKVKKKPWKVGVTDKGEEVYAPVAGPNAKKVLHLKFNVGVCKACKCTVHKRNAYVDPHGNVYCKSHWPYGRVSENVENRRLIEDGNDDQTDQ